MCEAETRPPRGSGQDIVNMVLDVAIVEIIKV